MTAAGFKGFLEAKFYEDKLHTKGLLVCMVGGGLKFSDDLSTVQHIPDCFK